MDVELNEEQQLFHETTRRFLEAECSSTVVRDLQADPIGFDPSFWEQGAALGWTSMLVPEADGGGSLTEGGLCDLAIVAEELGRAVAPGPFGPTNVVAAGVAAAGSSDQRALLPSIVAGETIAAWAFGETGVRWDPARVSCAATAVDGGFVLSGVKRPVEAGAQAQQLLVTARTEGGLSQFLVPADAPGVVITPMESLDLVRRFAEVRLDDVVVDESAVVGVVGGAAAVVEHQLGVALVLQCAETCGATERVLEFTLEYLDDRYSFGRPLSSYQALKHRLADMKMWVEASQAITEAAADAVQSGAPDAGELASAAKAYVAGHAVEIVQDCVQMHGGIGVTWEHDIHLFLRRVTLNRGVYGSPAEHRERIAGLLGMEKINA